MGHLVFLILQVFFIVLYALFKAFDWAGVTLIYLFSWLLSVPYYFSLTIDAFKQKKHIETITYFAFILLILCIPNKIWFSYHNAILHLVIIIGFLTILNKYKSYCFNKYFKVMSYLIISVNVMLFFLSDNLVIEKLAAKNLYKSYSNGQISWNNFNKRDSIDGDFDAEIGTFISYKVNHVYNYTSARAIAEIDLSESQYVTQSDNLLEHEYYHFKITELVTRRLNKALDNYHFGQPVKTQEIIDRYLDTLDNMQNAYDKETNHNLIFSKQKEWEIKIDQELEKNNHL